MKTTTFFRAMAMVVGAALCAGAWTACGAAEGTARADGEPVTQTAVCPPGGASVSFSFPGHDAKDLAGVRAASVNADGAGVQVLARFKDGAVSVLCEPGERITVVLP